MFHEDNKEIVKSLSDFEMKEKSEKNLIKQSTSEKILQSKSKFQEEILTSDEIDTNLNNLEEKEVSLKIVASKSIFFEPKHQELWIYDSPKDHDEQYLEIKFLQQQKQQKQCSKKKSNNDKQNSNVYMKVGRIYEITSKGKYRMKQPFKILLDIWDILVPRSFRDTLNSYVDAKLMSHVENIFDSDLCKRVWNDLSNLSDHNFPAKLNRNDCRKTQIKALCENINFCRKNTCITTNLKINSFQDIIDEIWLNGYTTKELIPPLYDDVLSSLKCWNSDPLFIKVYTLATGSAPYQKTFLSATDFGKPDNQYLIKDNFNSQNRYKFFLFSQVASAVNEWNPQNLFYITSSLTRAKESSKARLTPILMLRNEYRNYSKEKIDSQNFIVINSLDDLEFYEFGLHKNECC